MRGDGLRVWFDEWEVQPGDIIGLKVEEGLVRSRDLILCMSEHAFSSEWIGLERHTAIFRDPTNQDRRFIPLRLDDAEINDVLKQYAYVEWRESPTEEYNHLLSVCRPQQAVRGGTLPPYGAKPARCRDASTQRPIVVMLPPAHQ